MPHLHIEKFESIEFPQTIDGVDFNFMVQNANHDKEWLISTTIDEEKFFLLVK